MTSTALRNELLLNLNQPAATVVGKIPPLQNIAAQQARYVLLRQWARDQARWIESTQFLARKMNRSDELLPFGDVAGARDAS